MATAPFPLGPFVVSWLALALGAAQALLQARDSGRFLGIMAAAAVLWMLLQFLRTPRHGTPTAAALHPRAARGA